MAAMSQRAKPGSELRAVAGKVVKTGGSVSQRAELSGKLRAVALAGLREGRRLWGLYLTPNPAGEAGFGRV